MTPVNHVDTDVKLIKPRNYFFRDDIFQRIFVLVLDDTFRDAMRLYPILAI